MSVRTSARTGGNTRSDSSAFLRTVLKLDAVASGANGVVYLALGAALSSTLGLPTALLWPVGAFLLAWTAGLWVLATRPAVSRPLAWVVVGANLLWAVDSVVLLAAGWYPVTVWGELVVAAQAVAVAGFAVLQYLGLRRMA